MPLWTALNARTICVPQDRITDHRVGLTLHGLHEILSGGETAGGAQLDHIIDALAVAEQSKQLEAMSEADD